MAVPTRVSRGSPFEIQFAKLNNALINAVSIAANQKTAMAAGLVLISNIVNGLYIPFAGASSKQGIWHTVLDITADPAFMNYYYDQMHLRLLIDPDNINLTTDRITLNGNRFVVDDPVKFEGPGTPPAPLDKTSNYFVFDKLGEGVSFKTIPAGAKIDLTNAGSGAVFCEYRAIPDINTLTTALEAVIDQVITDVPVTATTLEIRAQKFDKALASSVTGIAEVSLSSAQTATLQTKLQDVIDAIEPAV